LFRPFSFSPMPLTILTFGHDAGHRKDLPASVGLHKHYTMQQKISITHLDNKHGDWLRALDFYKQEIGILKGRLTEIASKNTGPDAMKQVEHFENQFKIHINNSDELKHEINANVSETSRQAQAAKAGYIDSDLMTRHLKLEHAFSSEEKVVNELRQDFNKFAAKWM
jgi:hypothetical protein